MSVTQRGQRGEQEAYFFIYIQQESYWLTRMCSPLCLPLSSFPSSLCNCFKLNLIWDNQQKDEPGLSLQMSASLCGNQCTYVIITNVF